METLSVDQWAPLSGSKVVGPTTTRSYCRYNTAVPNTNGSTKRTTYVIFYVKIGTQTIKLVSAIHTPIVIYIRKLVSQAISSDREIRVEMPLVVNDDALSANGESHADKPLKYKGNKYIIGIHKPAIVTKLNSGCVTSIQKQITCSKEVVSSKYK